MKVYVFASQSVYGYEDYGINVQVFATKEDAEKALAQWRQDEIEELEGKNWVILDDEPDSFEIFLERDWCCNHSCGYVKEFEV